MIDDKSRGFAGVLEQAKTQEEVKYLCQLCDYYTDCWGDKCSKLCGQKLWVSVGSVEQELSLLQEKERSLRKLLEEIQFSIVDYFLDTCVFGDDFRDTLSESEWNIVDSIMEFSREFEGLRELLGDEEK